jgi:hypothetical protein
LGPAYAPLVAGSNPLTFYHLALTILAQVGGIGCITLAASLVAIPYFVRLEERTMQKPKGAKRVMPLLFVYTFKGVGFIALVGTVGVLLTDIGWPQAFQNFPWWQALLMARAAGKPNGAHLLSYIPLPLLGLYVAYKFRKDVMLDCYQGIFVVGLGVAVHELIWIVAYYIEWGRFLTLASWTNVTEDMGFAVMCVLLFYAYWKYPYRSISLKTFKWPVVVYTGYIIAWLADGLPITTINNFTLGAPIYGQTPLWADPLTNLIEVVSWLLIAATFWIAIWYES